MDRGVYDRMDDLEARHWWFAARREIIAASISRLIELPASPSILEAGCGTGGNLQMLKRLGEVDAFEFDAEARQLAAIKSGLEIVAGALPDRLPFDGKRYDLICLFDVLEHVEDDVAALAALSDRLRPSGRLLLTVPAYQWLWSRHDERHHHFRRYSRQTLARAVEAAGLAVEHSFYFNTLLFPVALGMRGLKTLLQIDTPDDEFPRPAILNEVFHSIFSSERHFVGRASMPFGLSLCAVAARSQRNDRS